MTYHKPKGAKVPKTDRFAAITAMEKIIVKFGDSYTNDDGHVILKDGWNFHRLLETLQKEQGPAYNGYSSAGGLYNLCVETFGPPRPRNFFSKQREEKSVEDNLHDGKIASYAELSARVRDILTEAKNQADWRYEVRQVELRIRGMDSTKRLDSMAASMVSFDKRLHAYDEVNKALEESSRQLAGQVLYLRKVLAEETAQRRAVQQKLNDFLLEWGKETVPLEEPGPRLVTTSK